MIENYLKDLMAIPRPRVDNFDLLDGIDRVSHSISDCINLTETSLRKRKSSIKCEKFSPESERTSDIFSGLDRIDDKIAYCIKLAEDTLNSGRPDEQERPGFTNPWATGEYNPRIIRTGNTSSKPNVVHSLEPFSEDIFSKLSDLDQDQAFIEYLDEFHRATSEEELVEWLDNIFLFMDGLSNPDELEELWEQSNSKQLRDESQSR